MRGKYIGQGQDITGFKSGKLTVIAFSRMTKKWSENALRYNYKYFWKCQCDCGNIAEVASANIKSNATLSCGCMREPLVRRSYSPYAKYLVVKNN